MPYNQELYIQWYNLLDRTGLQYQDILFNKTRWDKPEVELRWEDFFSFKENRDFVSSMLGKDDVLLMDSYFISPLSDDNGKRLNILVDEFDCKQIIVFHPDTAFEADDVFGYNGNPKIKIISPTYNDDWDIDTKQSHYNFYLCNSSYQSDKWLSELIASRYADMLRYKKFITHNGVYKGHRTLIYDTLEKNDLLKDTFFSYSAYNIFDDNICKQEDWDRETKYEEHIREFLETSKLKDVESYYSRERHTELLKTLPKILDYVPNLSNVDQFAFTLPYTCNSYVEIIGCTTICGGNQVYTSEKIFKPFMSMQIPIFVGQCGLVKILRELGFEMFDDIIDNSYDDIEDNLERMKAVSEEIKKIGSWSREELHNKYNSQMDVAYRNSQRLKELFHLQSENLRKIILGDNSLI